MKRLLILLIPLLPLLAHGQNYKTKIDAEVRQVALTPKNVANSLQAIADGIIGVTATGTNTYAATGNTVITSYQTGLAFDVKFTNPNSGACTFNYNTIGAANIYKNVSTALVTGDILAGQVHRLVYDGTNFQMTTAVGAGGGASSWGSITGTLSSQTDLYPQRTVTGSSAIVQSDNLGKIYFNSATPFNFTIDQLLISSECTFINIGTATVTFVNGTGVTFTGITSLPGGVNATAFIAYRTVTAPVILGGEITPGQLTVVDDANIDLVLGGTPTEALLKDASITAAWTGQLSGTRGGSGISNAGNFTWGANNITFTTSGSTSLTLPTSGTLATVGNSWKTSGTSTISGAATISNGIVNGITFNGSPTLNATNQYHFLVAPTNLTLSNNTGHLGAIANIGGTVTSGVNSQVLRGLVINPTYAYNGFTRANYSQLGLDIRDSNGNGFKFYTDAFTNTNNSFQLVNPSGVTTAEMVVDAAGFAISSNSGKTLTLNSGSTFRLLTAGARVVEFSTPTLDVSRNLFGPSWDGIAVTSTATQRGANAAVAWQGRGWNGSSAVTTYMLETFDASTATNLLFTQDKRFWNGSAMTDISRTTSTGLMTFGGIQNPNVTVDINGGIATRATSPAQITSNQNDYPIGTGTFFRLSTDASRNITSMTGGADGKHLIIVNVGSNNIVFTHDDGATGTAANRILSSTAANLTIVPNGSITLIYDGTTQRWRDIAVR